MAVRLLANFKNNFIVDNHGDLNHIDKTKCNFGDMVYVVEEGNTYVLNSKKQWRKAHNFIGSVNQKTNEEMSIEDFLTDENVLSNDDIDALIDNF